MRNVIGGIMIQMAKRRLSYTYKLPARSVEAVRDRFDQALSKHQKGRRILIGNRKLSAEAFTNAIVLQFLDLDEEAQFQILERYVPQFEAMSHADGDPAQKHGPESVRMPPPPITGELTPVDRPREPSPGAITGELTPVKRKGRKKSG